MIAIPTCLILGAGASMPYGFPSGEELKWQIIDEAAQPNNNTNKALRAVGISQPRLAEFVTSFEGSKQASIDAFLATNPGFSDVGRAAIAAVLIQNEHLGRLLRPPDPDDDWISHVWASLQETGKEDFDRNVLSIVSFNYDRSVERSLRDAYHHSFNVPLDQATAVIRETIPIVQVHGSLGELVDEAGATGRLYRPVPEDWAVKQAAEQIIVLPTGKESSPEFKEARRLIAEAKRVICLGCAYHERNMSRLNLKTGQGGGQRIGTGFGLNELERHIVMRRHGIKIGDTRWKSARFLRERVDLGETKS